LKSTLMLQEPFAATVVVVPHAGAAAAGLLKSPAFAPVILMAVMVMAAVPVFVSFTVWAALLVPAF
jgi:hypothetical protein